HAHRDLHSFPTRRSSDLSAQEVDEGVKALRGASADFQRLTALHQQRLKELQAYEAQIPAKQAAWEKKYGQPTKWETLEVAELKRSEEHTSELQSPCNLVC